MLISESESSAMSLYRSIDNEKRESPSEAIEQPLLELRGRNLSSSPSAPTSSDTSASTSLFSSPVSTMTRNDRPLKKRRLENFAGHNLQVTSSPIAQSTIADQTLLCHALLFRSMSLAGQNACTSSDYWFQRAASQGETWGYSSKNLTPKFFVLLTDCFATSARLYGIVR